MAAERAQCLQCGTMFYGRADARYCCGSCRQKAYRQRNRQRAAAATVTAPQLGDAVARAQQTREQARSIREMAAATRRVSAQARARLKMMR